ncbi:hypothetical protein [Embleya scabrispora]|uniref:hypothetical protein n=1 Tax=Embleya scabrispora TaxID=159449 RepID=UPI001374DA70|nr:hypothetical protein [Embleya scabrispora]
MTERVVLAHSGGLGTSVRIPWVAEETGAVVTGRRSDQSLYDFDPATRIAARRGGAS